MSHVVAMESMAGAEGGKFAVIPIQHDGEVDAGPLGDDSNDGNDSNDDNDDSASSSSSATGPDIKVPTGLTLLNGIALVIGLQIGSGIFLVPSQVSRNVLSPGLGVLVWLLAGGFVWTGVCSFIELGTSIARNGGLQEYLRHCYGDFMAALFSWTWVLIARSASMAVVTRVFAENLCKAFFPGAGTPPVFVVKVVGLTGLWLTTIFNWTGPTAGANLANKFLILKIGALVAISSMGFLSTIRRSGDGVISSPYGWFGIDPATTPPPVGAQIANLVTATFGALFCYNGFESVGFVLGDVRDPARNLPRILHISMNTVITGFLFTNISLYQVLSMVDLRSTDTPAISFASKILGLPGVIIFSIIVAISALGALNANLFATASLSVAASQRGYFPRVIGNLHCASRSDELDLIDSIRNRLGRYLSMPIVGFVDRTAPNRWEKRVPVFALTVNAALVTIYFLLGNFDSLLTFIGISQYLFYMFAVAGVFIVRHQKPSGDGSSSPSRSRMGWWNPLIFSLCSFFIVVRGILSNVAQGVALCSLALMVFILFKLRFSPGSRD